MLVSSSILKITAIVISLSLLIPRSWLSRYDYWVFSQVREFFRFLYVRFTVENILLFSSFFLSRFAEGFAVNELSVLSTTWR